ncbi:MAG TPA: chromosome segregation protein SMC [Stellaceae bacterium]|jgi:chromosome segregation protein|nr:chromosome segregation protein SMC [Stellaceae bacterium]
MQFSKLKLSGFKTFVDATELAIEPGITGVVGPNGCGKSNLVEALRWAMGETSAKRMRGGEMDDVIFAGTQSRPARNIAEVTLCLDNTAKRAPGPFAEEDEIEVTRRIERGSGSGYRVNSREVRARDVQLLFADAASGSQSAAMIGQGRISAVINAKPVERRAILEEAAGIAGLHARRHEAELRLKAAEANLSRLDDVIVTLAAQLDGLRKQAKQAQRYRRLAEQIRRFEAVALHRRWQVATAELDAAQRRLNEAEIAVADRTQSAVTAQRAREDVAAALPALRQAEAAAAAELQRLTLAMRSLDEEERRVAAARAGAQERLTQLASDRAREDELANDAAAAIERLTGERDGLTADQAREAEAQIEAAAALARATQQVEALEAELTRRTRVLADEDARRGAFTRQIAEAVERRERLTARQPDLARQRAALDAEAAAAPRRADAEAALAAANERVEASRAAADAAAETLRQAEAALAAARAPLQDAQNRRAKFEAEIQALNELLATFSGKRAAPVLDAVSVTAGYEAALGAALGDDLTAPVESGASVHWYELPAYAYDLALPGDAKPLARFVEAPPLLARRLAQIGVVADSAEAARWQAALLPGQRLVTRDGGLWRWDGLRRAPGTPSAAAQRLRQRNRLIELDHLKHDTDAEAATLAARFDEAQRAATEANGAERAGRDAMRGALAALAQAQKYDAECREAEAAIATRRVALDDTSARLAADLDDAAARETEGRTALDAIPDPAQHHEAIAALRLSLAAQRGEEADCRASHDRLKREGALRGERLAAIGREIGSWQSRAEAAARQRQRIAERETALAAELEQLDRRPAEISAERERLAETIAASTQRRNAAGDALAAGETGLKRAEAASKEAEAALAATREDRVRAEADRDHAQEHRTEVEARIAERLGCDPAEILDTAQIEPNEELPALGDAEARLERLIRERDNIGPVNLVAETEAAEIEARYDGLAHEREDLTAAIGRLRHGIAALNREGRERMLAAFAQVNEHFGRLFARLFGGGRAFLRLDRATPETPGDDGAEAATESAVDPLDAGLEILAQPPGKKLQAISLLSGGEQALTALALIFAAFLTNPAPICVMDEVDAPLDDANVDRFCSLVAEIADQAETRFLIITHHRLTMARMDRLYGVTMSEQGVSQLVSVDLQRAEELRQTA